MYALFTDETNMPNDPRATFFAYGGLIVPISGLATLHDQIEDIRTDAGYRPEDEFKFETNSRPDYVSIQEATQAKARAIEACINIGCKFIVYVVLHALARNRPRDNLVTWGADHVIGKFNAYLRSVDAYGIVALDRLSNTNEYQLLRRKFSTGLTLQDGERINLDRIVLFSSTCINASHASSAMDIVLGSFRYCINDPRNIGAAQVMMENITRLIWCVRDGDDIHAFEQGLIFRPRDVRVERYRAEYGNLLARINDLLNDEEED